MQNNRNIKLLPAVVILSAIIIGCVGNQEPSQTNGSVSSGSLAQPQKSSVVMTGLAGDYYSDPDFTTFVLSSVRKDGVLSFDEEEQKFIRDRYAKTGKATISSVRWQGLVRFDNAGRYFLRLEQSDATAPISDYQVNFSVDGQVVNQTNNTSINITDPQQLHRVKIEVSGNKDIQQLGKLQLVAVKADTQEIQKFDNKHLYVSLGSNNARAAAESANQNNVVLDFHKNALNGFFLFTAGSGNVLMASWKDADYASGATKYFSSSADLPATLAGASPWSDEQKIFGSAQQDGVTYDALNPVVAAYPIIRPILQYVDLTDNSEVSMSFNSDSSTSTNVSNSQGQSSEEGWQLGGDIGLSFLDPFKIGFSANWHTSSTNSSNMEWGSSNSLNHSSGVESSFNPSELKRLVFAVKFHNTGTAAVDNLTYQLNLTTGTNPTNLTPLISEPIKDGRMIARISPEQTTEPIVIDANDSFNSSPIHLDKFRYDLLKEPKSGVVVTLPEIAQDPNSNIKWSEYLANLPRITAKLMLRTPKRDIERRVFA